MLVDEICEFGVPLILGRHVVQVEGGGEHVAPQLLQLLALLEQLLRRQVSFPMGKNKRKITFNYKFANRNIQFSNSQAFLHFLFIVELLFSYLNLTAD